MRVLRSTPDYRVCIYTYNYVNVHTDTHAHTHTRASATVKRKKIHMTFERLLSRCGNWQGSRQAKTANCAGCRMASLARMVWPRWCGRGDASWFSESHIEIDAYINLLGVLAKNNACIPNFKVPSSKICAAIQVRTHTRTHTGIYARKYTYARYVIALDLFWHLFFCVRLKEAQSMEMPT